MLVTIYTDGGIRNGHCVFAFAARSALGWLKGFGEIPTTKHIELVEFNAVLAATNKVLQEWPETTVLFYNVDNLAVVHTMWHVAKISYRVPAQTILEQCKNLYAETDFKGLQIRTKHVKGHQTNLRGNIRGYMNSMVDKIVKANYK